MNETFCPAQPKLMGHLEKLIRLCPMSDTLCHHCDCLMLLAMYKSGMEDFEGSMQEFISMKKSLISIVFHIVISIFTFVRHRLLLMLFCIEEHLFCFIGLLEAVFWTLITRVVCH